MESKAFMKTCKFDGGGFKNVINFDVNLSECDGGI